MNFQGFLKQSTAVTVTILMVDSSDHITGKTGLAAGLTVYQSKAGAATGAITPTSVTELDATNAKGLYAVALNTTSWTNTLGEMILHITATGADPADYKWWITARLPDDLAFPATTGRSMATDASGVSDARLADAVSHGGTLGSSTATLALSRISVVSQSVNAAGLTLTGNGSGPAATLAGGASGIGMRIDGNGAAAGMQVSGGTTGIGFSVVGGGTSGDGIKVTTTSGHAMNLVATGTTAHGLNVSGGATTSHGINATGGGVGHGILATSGGGATGDGIRATAASTNGNGMNLVGNGTSNGLLATGGAGAGGDGAEYVAGGGVPIRGDHTGNITGTLATVTNLTNLPTIPANWLTAAGTATDFGAELATAIWTDITAGDFTVASSVGKSLMNGVALGTGLTIAAVATGGITRASFAADTGKQSARSNTLASATGTTAVLDASASAVDDFYNNDLLIITGGTGVGQARFITDYVGATKTCTVGTWITNPDSSSTFAIVPLDAGSSLDAAAVRAAIGMSSANLDTQLAAVQSDTDNIQTRIPAALTANGNMKSSVLEFIATSLTETSGQIAAAFKQFFDVASPTGTMKAITNVVTATNLTTNNDKTGYALTSGERNSIADAILARNVSGGSSSGRLVSHAMAALRNKCAISAGTLTVYDVDDTTPLWDATVTTAAGNPLASIDPS